MTPARRNELFPAPDGPMSASKCGRRSFFQIAADEGSSGSLLVRGAGSTFEVDAVQVKTPYLGAAPEEVESAVCVRVEEAIEGTEGVDRIRSVAAENSSSRAAANCSGREIAEAAAKSK